LEELLRQVAGEPVFRAGFLASRGRPKAEMRITWRQGAPQTSNYSQFSSLDFTAVEENTRYARVFRIPAW
jgi:hypothetical protein